MIKFLSLFLLMTFSASYAMQMDRAVVIDHKSSISGRNDKGRAVKGHIEEVNAKIRDAGQKTS